MAEKRMFSKKVIDSDAFLSMPATTQNLYFHLAMRADDDGFINNTKSIMYMIGAKDDDLRVLISREFVLPFQTGVIVIRHWRVHNTLRKDRYTSTQYTAEKSQLIITKDRPYRLKSSEQGQIEAQTASTRQSTTKSHSAPTVDEIEQYCQERKNNINAQYFFDYYQSRNWYSGKRKITDWQAVVRLWEQKEKDHKTDPSKGSAIDYDKDFQ